MEKVLPDWEYEDYLPRESYSLSMDSASRVAKTTAYLALMVALAILPSGMDGFSTPKFTVLVAGSFFVLGLLIVNYVTLIGSIKQTRIPIALALIFVVISICSTIASSNRYQAIFGAFGRQAGVLTYIALVILFIATILTLTSGHIHLLLRVFLISGLWVGGYAVFQFMGIEPFPWERIYQGSFSFLGNPNFVGAYMGTFGALCVWNLLTAIKSKRLLWLAGILFASFAIYTSRALQGAICLMIGTVTALILFSWIKKKPLLPVVLVSSVLGFSISLAGMLNFGPLKILLHKESVEYRGDFWRAAFRMTKDNWLFGVGIDNYSNNFRLYRDKVQLFRNGYENVSDSAHNALLQLTSTGGIFLGLSYLALMIYIFVIVIRTILVDKQKANLISPVFVVWLSLQAQSLISVDSVSLTVWTWIFSGALIAICVEQPIEGKKLLKDVKTISRAPSKYRRVSAVTLTVVGVSLSVLPSIGQIAYRSAFIEIFDPASSQSVKLKTASLINSEKIDSKNATWPRYSAQLLYANGAYLEASQAAKRVLNLDKNDYVGWWYLASSLEKLSQRKSALQAREMTVKLDPLNPANLLEYSLDLAENGDVALSQEIKNQIIRNYPGTAEAKMISDSQTK